MTSTMNPKSDEYVHHAIVLVNKSGENRCFSLASGQSKYIDTRKSNLLSDGYKIVVDKFYQPNGIDYRRNVQSALEKLIVARLKPWNDVVQDKRDRLAIEIDEHNTQLRTDNEKFNQELAERVRMHNTTATGKDVVTLAKSGTYYRWRGIKVYDRLRIFDREKRVFDKECQKYSFATCSMKVNARSVLWKPNNYVSYNDVIRVINDVKEETQRSPRESFDSTN